MSQIAYIDHQLTRWAEWLRTGRTRLGYPKKAAFVGAMGGGNGSVITLPDDEAMDVCTAVAALPPDIRAAVDCYYRTMRSCTAKEIAQHLGCSRDTVYFRIEKAHVLVMGYLNDMAADIPVPPWVADVRKSA